MTWARWLTWCQAGSTRKMKGRENATLLPSDASEILWSCLKASRGLVIRGRVGSSSSWDPIKALQSHCKSYRQQRISMQHSVHSVQQALTGNQEQPTGALFTETTSCSCRLVSYLGSCFCILHKTPCANRYRKQFQVARHLLTWPHCRVDELCICSVK